MKVAVDGAKCTGHARCQATAPEVFALDELGYAVPGEREIAAGAEAEARRGASACPERAITVWGDPLGRPAR
ncbi:putative ferredoxin protein [Pseudofrankia inefficax]|uniref:Putative ferredoxin protein n=1 Tax=Pseudofrankia inefficax (strain DSM 45817 / CECT 9037 / DDB 130130 / EuI1c) TaxID=298654 RepID=E3J2L5_PSEI1|nr:putative ferredoxin protein [Pseudofrankia inefficax]